MNSYFKYPEPFTDGIHSSIEIELSFSDRLRVLFGATIFLEHDTLTEHGPGRVQSTTRVNVRRLTRRALDSAPVASEILGTVEEPPSQ